MEKLSDINYQPIELKDHEKVYCDDCGDQIIRKYKVLGKVRKMKIMCSCKNEEYERRQKQKELEQKQMRIERMKEWSIMDKDFKKCTLDTFQVDNKQDERNKKIIENYIKSWGEIKQNNNGLLLFGPVGRGKTRIASTIVNELINNSVPAIAININGFLARLRETYNKFGEDSDYQIINKLKNISLLYLDDLGAERSTDYAKEKVYELIDARYRSRKPIIVTTNVDLKKLKDIMCKKDNVPRTFDRLKEMCMVYEVKGKNRRTEKSNENQKVLRKLLG